MITEGREEEARRFVDKYAREISLADVAEDFKETMSEFTQLERSIRASDMSPDEKRSKLDELRRAKIMFATSFNAASRQQ
jgi:polyhydroxyalkanoate synthesis regulator phasin